MTQTSEISRWSFSTEFRQQGVIGVYPVSGWRKDQAKRDRSDKGARYALVVTIEPDSVGVDIWMPVATEVGIPVETAVLAGN